ncbi:hypothetical protein IT568_10275 [bacterium]|nr:hypothetical protein [bacterium]
MNEVEKKCSAFSISTGCKTPPNQKLIAEGWELRYLADARMCREAVDTYTQLGYEVVLEAFQTDLLREECSGCKSSLEQFKVVYTRKKG